MFIKVIVIGLAVCAVNIFLKKQASEFILPIEIVFFALTSAFLIDSLKSSISPLSEIMNDIRHGEEILSAVIKGSAVCLVTKFSADICQEGGNGLISDVIEFSGRIMLFIIALPYIESIMKTALAFLK